MVRQLGSTEAIIALSPILCVFCGSGCLTERIVARNPIDCQPLLGVENATSSWIVPLGYSSIFSHEGPYVSECALRSVPADYSVVAFAAAIALRVLRQMSSLS